MSPWSGLDTTAYVELANKVQAGDWGLGPGLYYVSPFYIYFLALGLAVTKSFTAVRVIQAFLGTAGIGFMYLTAREWFNERAAWITALLAGCTGLFAFYEALILQTSVDVFLTSAALLCLTYALRAGPDTERWTGRWALGAGVVFGLQTLNRPQIAIAVFLLMVLLGVLRRWRHALLLTAGLVIGISPSVVRNALVSHQFSLLSSQGGLNFYIGNGEGATGFYRFLPGITPTIKGQSNDTRQVASRALGRSVNDLEASDYFTNRALSWMSAHPMSAALLLIRKFGWTFHAQHVALPYSYPFYQHDFQTWLRFMVVGPWLLVPLGIVGLLFARRVDTSYLVFLFFVPAYAVAVALFLISERYRLPLLVPLAIGSGAAVDMFIRFAQQKSWRSLTAPVAIAAVLAVLVNTRAIADDGRWDEGKRMAAQLVLEERYAEAGAWVDRLEAKTKHPGDASAAVGLQLLVKNQPARALEHLERAAALDRDNKPSIEYSLGQALLGVGRTAEALPHLERGFNGGATVPLAGYHLAVALKNVGRAADAVPLISRIKMSDDSTAEDWLTVGRLAMEMNAPDQAAPYFQKAVTLAPGNAGAHLQFGVNLVVLKRFADAARELTEATRLDPKSASGFAYLAYSEMQLGSMAQAKAHVAAALALDPNDPMAKSLASMR